MQDTRFLIEADWRSSWLLRIVCALALWGFGIVSVGLLLSGIVMHGLQPGAGPLLAITGGVVATAVYLVLCRLTVRAGLTLAGGQSQAG